MDLDYIYTSYLPNNNANSVHVMHFSEALSSKFNFRLFAYFKDNEKVIFDHYAIRKKFPIQNLYANKYLFLIYLLCTNKLKKNIYVRDFFCALILAFFRKKVIWESHIHSNQLKYKIGYKIAFSLNLFYKVVVITEGLKNKFEPYTQLDRLVVLPDGCREQKRTRNHINKKKLNIGYVGSFFKGKGVDTVLEIAKKVPEHSFLIAGGSKDDVINAKKNSSNNVKFLGYLNQQELPLLYKDLDIALLPNKPFVYIFNNGQEIGDVTSPLKLFEYFSYGIPIISSNLDILKEILSNKNSILVKYDDVNEWCRAIKRLENTETRRMLSQNGLNDLKVEYSWMVRAIKVNNIFE